MPNALAEHVEDTTARQLAYIVNAPLAVGRYPHLGKKKYFHGDPS